MRSARRLGLVVVGVVLVVVASWMGTSSAWAASAPRNDSAGARPRDTSAPLTFEERVAYQRAIEEVYWRHRIWPKENADPKPPLAEVMPDSAIRQKVEDALLKSQLLGDWWQRPITAEQLQAEMDRMAKQTRQPDMLRELFEALGNDPYVIAECLARPSLADRLIRTWYAYDERIHGELKTKADAELKQHTTLESLRSTSGQYSEQDWVLDADGKSDACKSQESAARAAARDGGATLVVQGTPCRAIRAGEWQEQMGELMTRFGAHAVASPLRVSGALDGRDSLQANLAQLPTGSIGRLQQDERGFFASALVINETNHVRLATVEWRKTPLDSWLAAEGKRLARAGTTAGDYPQHRLGQTAAAGMSLPAMKATSVAQPTPDSWRPFSGLVARKAPAVWTGTEMVVWGGWDHRSGARYNPTTDSWTPMTAGNAPVAVDDHVLLWTGSQVIVWGGTADGTTFVNSGARYDPAGDAWSPTSTVNAPPPRYRFATAWTGTEMIIWGGYKDGYFGNGGRYDPSSDTWRTISTSGAPQAREYHSAVWTGTEMVVWGGYNSGSTLNTGGRYNPRNDSWRPTSVSSSVRGLEEGHTEVWTGTEMIVWGGGTNDGARYNPTTDTWAVTSKVNAPEGRLAHSAVWTGREMIIWGGAAWYAPGRPHLNTGGRYDPVADQWKPTTVVGTPEARGWHAAVWTGKEMLVWGGYSYTGGRYDPTGDMWLPIASGLPYPFSGESAVWTGTEMIVWAVASRYDNAIDSWKPMNLVGAPGGEFGHSAVWTGRTMIIWGGTSTSWDGKTTYYGTGARYDPSTDAWAPTSTAMSPRYRKGHTAVWSGTEMIVWGGYNPLDLRLGDGARYNPVSNTWVPLPTANTPSARTNHTAVWTGTEMLVWGGDSNTGGKYNRSSDGWTALSTTNAPSARTSSTAVWTGSDMIVWGGFDGASATNTGGRYKPVTDSWTPTGPTGAPTGRQHHTAIWTGREMIVWGGDDLTNYFNSGGRYDPVAKSWTPTTTIGAPGARNGHTATWAGKEMIVWGGAQGAQPIDAGGRYFVGLPPGAPTASSTFLPQSPAAGAAVRFTDTSTGTPTSWAWTFGDGGTSTEQSPSHTYGAAGQYAVHLTVTNPNGSDTAASLITVRPAGQALADLAVTLSALPNPVETGKDLTYASTVTNNGPDGATAVVLKDTLPAGVTFVSSSASQGSCSNASGVVTCNLGALASGATATVTAVVRPTATGSLSNTVTVSSGSIDSTPGNNSATASTTVVAPGTTYTYVVPSIAHWPGLNNTAWRSDLSVVNPSTSTAQLTLAYYTGTGGMSTQVTDTVGARATKRWTDMLVSAFGLSQSGKDKGTLVVTSNVPLAVLSRTYNQTDAGTFGQHYPALTASDGMTAGKVGIMPHLSGNSGTTGYRTNVGVVNLGTAGSCSAVVKLYGGAGAQLGNPVTITADARRFKQQDSIFAAAGLGSQSIDVAYATIEVQTPACPMWPYASVVDNASGDPTTIEVIIL